MAKDAKTASAVDIPIRDVKSYVSKVLERYANIEVARGKFMNAARREREAMTVVYEGMAAKGVPQRVSKTEIKIVLLLERINGLMSDLEEEDRKMVIQLAKKLEDEKQLSLFNDLPKTPKRKKGEPKLELVQEAAE
jgi:hypothetical protein